jgi:hypothetical protein
MKMRKYKIEWGIVAVAAAVAVAVALYLIQSI